MELCSSKIDALFVKGEKCFVLAGQREKTNTFKAPFNVVTHEMCRERERESEKEANNLVYFFSFEQVVHTIEGKQTNEEILERDLN